MKLSVLRARPRAAYAALAVVAVPLLLAGPRMAGSGQGWALLPPAVVPAGASSTIFLGVSCTSRTACIAVGYDIRNGLSGTVAEGWDGTKWTLQPTPALVDADFFDVSCTSARSCTAVGDYTPGSFSRTLVEHWDGTTWTVQPTPIQGGLEGVDCTAASACMAVGGLTAERWNGTKWRQSKTGGASSVSCTSGRSCLAVGDPFGTMHSVTWDGATWTPQPVSLPAEFSSPFFDEVSCGGVATCVAVGGYRVSDTNSRALALTWDGTTWTAQHTAVVANDKDSELDGVACPRAGACTAVGSVRTSGRGSARPLAEHWDGTEWTTQHTTLLPPGTGASLFFDVSCPSTVYCLAVGYYVSRATHSDVAFAEQKVSP